MIAAFSIFLSNQENPCYFKPQPEALHPTERLKKRQEWALWNNSLTLVSCRISRNFSKRKSWTTLSQVLYRHDHIWFAPSLMKWALLPHVTSWGHHMLRERLFHIRMTLSKWQCWQMNPDISWSKVYLHSFPIHCLLKLYRHSQLWDVIVYEISTSECPIFLSGN